jgi:hypothetical protein
MNTATETNGAPTARYRIAALPGPVHDALTGAPHSPRVIQPEHLLVEAASEHQAKEAFCERFGIDPALANDVGSPDGRTRWRLERMPSPRDHGRMPYVGTRPDSAYAPATGPTWHFAGLNVSGISETWVGAGAGARLVLELHSPSSPDALRTHGTPEVDAALARLYQLLAELPAVDSRRQLENAEYQAACAREELEDLAAKEARALAAAGHAMNQPLIADGAGRSAVTEQHLARAAELRRQAAEARDRLAVLEALAATARAGVEAEGRRRAEWEPLVRGEVERLRQTWGPRLAEAKAALAQAVGEHAHSFMLAAGILAALPAK